MSLKDPPKTTNYISIRDDDGLRSLSRNERGFIRECALPALRQHQQAHGGRRCLRVDGRTVDQIRPVRLHLGRWDHGAECTVQWGNSTRVTSLCTAELVRPNLDRPNEGQLVISVDLSPGASPSFRQGPPSTTGGGGGGNIPNFASQNQRLLSNRILRCIEKIILTGGALDVEALCLIPSQWVWRFQLSLTVLDDGGNIMDASVMAAIASLRHYRKPQVDMVGNTNTIPTEQDNNNNNNNTASSASAPAMPVLIPSHLKEPTPLPLHHTPLAISFAFCPIEDGSSHSTAANALSSASASSSPGMIVAALADPTDREELIQNGSLTVGMNVHSEVCLLDYGGGCELPPSQLEECWKKAEKSIRKLCTHLETSLEEADQQAQKDRLAKLVQQQEQQQQEARDPDLPPLPSTGPYFQQSDNPGGGDEMIINEKDLMEIRRMETEAEEEAYKRKALDYGQGYQAQKVREDDDVMRNSSQPYFNQASNLFRSILSSATNNNTPPPTATKTSGNSNNNTEEEATTMAARKKKEESPPPPKKKKEVTTTTSKAGQIDSDEEETTELLQSEFQQADAAAATDAELASTKPVPMDVEDDIDDLAMAISSKKKKKKKKSKK